MVNKRGCEEASAGVRRVTKKNVFFEFYALLATQFSSYNGQFWPMLIGTFSALFLFRFYTNFSGKQCKIPLEPVFLRLPRGQKVAVADDFWSFSDYDLKQFNFFF